MIFHDLADEDLTMGLVESEAWIRFGAAALTRIDPTLSRPKNVMVHEAAEVADRMLEEFRRRFKTTPEEGT